MTKYEIKIYHTLQKIKNVTLKNVEKILNISKKLKEYFFENETLKDKGEMYNVQVYYDKYQEICKDLRHKAKKTLSDESSSGSRSN